MSDSPWLRHLPKGWKASRLKTVVKLRTVRVNSRASDENYIGLEAVEPWTGRLLESNILPSTPDDESENKNVSSSFEPGDVLFGKLRPYLAKGHLAREAGICTTELLVMTPRKNLDAKFLLNVLLTREFIDRVDAETFGTKMPRADWGTIRNLLIPLPTLPEQRAIADYLDRETAGIDELISEKERLLELLSAKRWTLLNDVLSHGLPPHPSLRKADIPWLDAISKHWEVLRGKYLFSQSSIPVRERDEMVTCFRNGQVTLRRNRREEGFTNAVQELGYQGIRVGQLVIHSMDAFAGAIGVSDSDGKCSPEYVICNPASENVSNLYYGQLLRVMALQGFILASCPAVRERAPRIRFPDLANMLLPVPPIEEQKEIAAYVASETRKIGDLQQATTETVKLLRERRAALISSAVTGQIRVEAES